MTLVGKLAFQVGEVTSVSIVEFVNQITASDTSRRHQYLPSVFTPETPKLGNNKTKIKSKRKKTLIFSVLRTLSTQIEINSERKSIPE